MSRLRAQSVVCNKKISPCLPACLPPSHSPSDITHCVSLPLEAVGQVFHVTNLHKNVLYSFTCECDNAVAARPRLIPCHCKAKPPRLSSKRSALHHSFSRPISGFLFPPFPLPEPQFSGVRDKLSLRASRSIIFYMLQR